MAKAKLNPALQELCGTIDDLVFAGYKPGETVIRKRTVRTKPIRPGEAVNHGQFRDAVRYAQDVWAARPELKAKYIAAARLQGRQAFRLAKADYLRPPLVQEIDLSGYTGNAGESIRVAALDDFAVQSVAVVIRDFSKALIEQGPAALENGQWVYRTQSPVPPGQAVLVEVTAADHPGHTATRRSDHVCGPRS